MDVARSTHKIAHRATVKSEQVCTMLTLTVCIYIYTVLSFSATMAKRLKVQFRLGFARIQQC